MAKRQAPDSPKFSPQEADSHIESEDSSLQDNPLDNLDSSDSQQGTSLPPLTPKQVPGKEESKRSPQRPRIPKEKKLKAAKSIGKTIQKAIDKANTIAVVSGTGFNVDFALVEKPSIPVDYRHGKDGIELLYVDGPGQAIAYHAQELGLDKVDSLLKLIDDNPRAIAFIGIIGAIAVNAYHVRAVTLQHASMVRREQEKEQRERIRKSEDTPVEGFVTNAAP